MSDSGIVMCVVSRQRLVAPACLTGVTVRKPTLTMGNSTQTRDWCTHCPSYGEESAGGGSLPAFFGRELNRVYNRRCYQREYNTDGGAVMAEDWDNLNPNDRIQQPGCRFDIGRA